eukprot:6233737-Prymnesium_polylepis.1
MWSASAKVACSCGRNGCLHASSMAFSERTCSACNAARARAQVVRGLSRNIQPGGEGRAEGMW